MIERPAFRARDNAGTLCAGDMNGTSRARGTADALPPSLAGRGRGRVERTRKVDR